MSRMFFRSLLCVVTLSMLGCANMRYYNLPLTTWEGEVLAPALVSVSQGVGSHVARDARAEGAAYESNFEVKFALGQRFRGEAKVAVS